MGACYLNTVGQRVFMCSHFTNHQAHSGTRFACFVTSSLPRTDSAKESYYCLLLLNSTQSTLTYSPLTLSCPCPSDRYLNFPPPNPQRSASFIKSAVGSDPGLSMNTTGVKGVVCSNIISKLKQIVNFQMKHIYGFYLI